LKRFVIGYGTGRCGTKSLAQFLNKQEGFDVTHEGVALGWYPLFTDSEKQLEAFASRNSAVIGDIAFYWIHYLDRILRKYKNAKAINIVRDDDEVIESFWSYKSEIRDKINLGGFYGYPFDSEECSKDAIAKTVKRYRFLETEAKKFYPCSIITLKTEDLNDRNKLHKLLNLIYGVEKDWDITPVKVNTVEQVLASKNAHKTERLFNTRRS